MSRFDFKLPDIGEGVAEGEVVAWHVKPGDSVNEDDPMVEVMTDKATVTIGAPKKGKILELAGPAGHVVKVGATLVSIDTFDGAAQAAGSAAAAAPQTMHAGVASAVDNVAPVEAPAPKSAGPAATAVGDIRESLPGGSYFSKKPAASAPLAAAAPASAPNGHGNAAVVSDYFAQKPLATPATRKLARDLEIDLRRVKPTGLKGRTTNEDVRSFASASSAGAFESPAVHEAAGLRSAPSAASPSRAPITIAAPTPEQQALEERKPFVGIRRKIAERMQTSKQTAAHFTFVEECDVGALKALHARMKPTADARGVKLTLLPFIAKAVVASLKKQMILNSALDESTNELVTRKYINLGIAASTDQGLMVPVVKNADRLSLLDLAKEIDRLGTGAKAGTLSSSDLTGSTFTITSLGKQGGLFATPILNFPEVGILGVHQIKQKPVVRDGQIVIGEVMLLSLSFDHRIVDGHVGAAFAYDVIGYLENPDTLFLDM